MPASILPCSLFVCISIRPSVRLSVYLSIGLSIGPSTCLSVSLFLLSLSPSWCLIYSDDRAMLYHPSFTVTISVFSLFRRLCDDLLTSTITTTKAKKMTAVSEEILAARAMVKKVRSFRRSRVRKTRLRKAQKRLASLLTGLHQGAKEVQHNSK